MLLDRLDKFIILDALIENVQFLLELGKLFFDILLVGKEQFHCIVQITGVKIVDDFL